MSVSHQFLLRRRDDPYARAALLQEMRPVVRRIAGGFYAPGLEHDDLVAIGLEGVNQAIDTYDGHGAFRAFAYMVARRQMITALKAARRGKHRPLNHAAALDAPYRNQRDDSEMTLADVLPGDTGDFADLLHTRDALRAMLERLSPLEQRILIGRMDGLTYTELAAALGKTEKTVDNGLQRCRHKLTRALAA